MKDKAIEIYQSYLDFLPMDIENRNELALKMSLRCLREIIESYEFDLINLALNCNEIEVGKDEDGRIMNRINYWDEVETELLRNTNHNSDSDSSNQ